MLIPLGHEAGAEGVPWVTAGLIMACVAVFALTFSADRDAMTQLEVAALLVDEAVASNPDARAPESDAAGIPGELLGQIGDLLVEDTDYVPREEDAELRFALQLVVEAYRDIPAIKYGYIPADHAVVRHLGMHCRVRIAGSKLRHRKAEFCVC